MTTRPTAVPPRPAAPRPAAPLHTAPPARDDSPGALEYASWMRLLRHLAA